MMNMRLRASLFLLLALLGLRNAHAQLGVTTFGLQVKPVVPFSFFEPVSNLQLEHLNSTLTLTGGFAFGMTVRTGIARPSHLRSASTRSPGGTTLPSPTTPMATQTPANSASWAMKCPLLCWYTSGWGSAPVDEQRLGRQRGLLSRRREEGVGVCAGLLFPPELGPSGRGG